MSSGKRFPEYQIIDGFILPRGFDPQAYRDSIKYKPKDDDLFVITYPKCGTTWMQYLAFLILNDGKAPKDMIEFNRQVPFMEMQGIDAVDNMIRPGILKTHFPFNIQPYSPKAKYIIVARNPKDCCVSFYHHTSTHAAYNFENGDFDVFYELFLKGDVDYGDYFDHLLSWYEHRNDPNVFFILYEDLKHKPKESVYKLAAFMGNKYKAQMDQDPTYADKIVHLSSADMMKKSVKPLSAVVMQPDFDLSRVSSGLRYFVNHIRARSAETGKDAKHNFTLVRKGVTGGWRDTLSDDQNKRLDEKIEKKLGGTDILRYWKDGGFI